MKFICLGFQDESSGTKMSQSERKFFMEQCFAYDAELRRGGHFLGGEALQPARNAATVRCQSEKVMVTDGPYAETKEQLGGILFLEARDLDQAIQRMAQHPGVRTGGFEIRPANEEINAWIAARKPSPTSPNHREAEFLLKQRSNR
ncbi:MAG TPA: YciI family protein [Gemmataceae bacterium]|nr:YciI family protein [Gemmataceae bacterium]